MQIYSETAIRDLDGLKLDFLSQPESSKDGKSITLRAESGDYIIYFIWSVLNLGDIKYILAVGCNQREQNAKDCVVIAGFGANDGVKTFSCAAKKLNISLPKDWQVLV